MLLSNENWFSLHYCKVTKIIFQYRIRFIKIASALDDWLYNQEFLCVYFKPHKPEANNM